MSVRGVVVSVLMCGLAVASCSGSDGGTSGADTSGTLSSETSGADGPVSSEGTASTSSDVVTTSSSTTSSTSTSTTTTSTTEVPLAVASAELIDANVEYKTVADADFVTLTEPVDVSVGDAVRTDATGFGVVAYFDGSLTRLDVDTEFEVLELIDDVDASTIRTRMGLGRTWHRVQSMGESGTFEVETSVATAVVQGTAFSVQCVSATVCTFMVVEGALQVVFADGSEVDLVAPAALTVDSDVRETPVPVLVPFDGAFGDEWLFDNAARDVAADSRFASAAEIYQAHGPAFGSVVGTFTGTRTVADMTCDPTCFDAVAPVGDVADRSYTFDVDCTSGIPCVGTIKTDYVKDDVLTSEVIPVGFDGTSYSWLLDFTGTYCSTDSDGDGAIDFTDGRIDTSINWAMASTAGEIIADRWVAVAMTGSGSDVNTVIDPGNCDQLPTTQTRSNTFDVSRQS